MRRALVAAATALSSLGGGAGAARADWRTETPAPAVPLTTTAAADGPVARHFVQRVRDDAAGGVQATVHFVLFDARRATFRVVDQGADGRLDLGAAMTSRVPGGNALAGVNGGYFHADFQPLGLVVSDGREIHAAERAALLSGLVLVGADGKLALLRMEEFRAQPQKSALPAPRQALQAGPFLVDGGRAVVGLNAVRPAKRTAVLTDGAGRWALASTSALTLAETGALLAQPGVVPDGFRVRRALNLDGGASTGLWVRGGGAAAAAEAPVYLREWSTVRNFLAVVPRER